MEHADELDTVRANMVASAQNSAAAAQENAASIQEIMASVASVYEELALITDKTKALGGLSSELKKSIGFFLATDPHIPYIAKPAYIFYIHRLRRLLFDLFPQPADIYRYRILIYKFSFRVKHMLQDLTLG